MLLTLLAKEIKVHLMTFRFNASLIVTFMLVVLSVWVLGNDFVARNNLYIQLSESYSEGSDQIFVPSQIRPILHKPPTPMSIFAQGKERRLGNTVVFSRWSVPSDAVDHLTNNKLTSDRVSYDLMTIFLLVISLFGLLLTYDAISGEREKGTLRLQCSYGFSRASIYAVKFAAGFIVISLPFLISFISALLVLNFLHGIAFTGEQWFALVLMIAAGLLYSAIFVAIGLVCSAIAQRSSSSLVLALLFWSLGILLVPSASNGLAKFIIPLLPPEEIEELELATGAELKQQLEDYRRDITPGAGQGSWMGAWIVDENVAMFDTFSVAQYEHNVEYVRFQEALKQDRADRIWNAQRAHLVRDEDQAGLAGILSYISPAQQLRAAFTQLSATGYRSHEEFLDACRRYRTTILNDFRGRGYFDTDVHDFFMRLPRELFRTDEQFDARWREYWPYIEQSIPFEQARQATGYFDEPLPDDFIPPFRYGGSRPDFDTALLPIGVLALMAILTFFIGFAIFLRYDVR